MQSMCVLSKPETWVLNIGKASTSLLMDAAQPGVCERETASASLK